MGRASPHGDPNGGIVRFAAIPGASTPQRVLVYSSKSTPVTGAEGGNGGEGADRRSRGERAAGGRRADRARRVRVEVSVHGDQELMATGQRDAGIGRRRGGGADPSASMSPARRGLPEAHSSTAPPMARRWLRNVVAGSAARFLK